jgi:O-antigen/teichoic acid export membrane protein
MSRPRHDEPLRPTVTGRDVGRRTVSGLGWMFLSGGGQVFLQVLVLAVLARYVTPAEFGVASAALVVMALTAVFTEAGVGTALVQRPEITTRHIRTAFTFQVAMAWALWGLIALSSSAIGAIFGIPEVADVVPVITLALVLQSLSLGSFLLQRDMAFRQLARVEFLSWAVGYGGVSIVLALNGAGVWSIVLGNVAQALLRTVQFWVLRPHAARPLLDRAALRELLFFGGGYTLGWWANFIARQGDNFVVGRWLGAAALGLYTRAYSLMRQPAMLFGRVVSTVLFPAMAAVQHDRPRVRTTYLRSVMLVALVVLPFTAVTALLSTELITVLLGERWLGVRTAFNIMVFGMLFRTSYKLSDALTTATGHVYQRAVRQGIYAGMVVGGALVGQVWGIQGVAFAILIALGTNFLLMARLALHVTDGRWSAFASAHVPGLILSVVVAGPTWAVERTMEAADAPAWATLLVAAAAAGVVAALTVRLAPRIGVIRPLAGSIADVLGVLRPGSRQYRAVSRLLGAGYVRPAAPPALEQVP